MKCTTNNDQMSVKLLDVFLATIGLANCIFSNIVEMTLYAIFSPFFLLIFYLMPTALNMSLGFYV